MKGVELAEVREAILSAYDTRKFDRFLLDHFNIHREHIAGNGPLRDIVDDVLGHFAQEGREAYLIAEIASDRTTKPEIQAIYDKYAAALLNDALQSKGEMGTSERLDRYGLLPRAKLQFGDTAPRPEPYTEPSTYSGFERQVHTHLPELHVLEWTSLLLRQTCRVCRVELNGAPVGTAFLVGPAAVLTSYHAIESAIRAHASGSSLTFLFDFWKKPGGIETAGRRVTARGAWTDWHIDSSPPLLEAEEDSGVPEARNDRLDHALISLEEPIGDKPIAEGGPKRGWIEVPTTPSTLGLNMPIVILHHPRTGPLKVTLDTNALQSINASRTRMRYSTNTDEGSSGSPCFNLSFGLLGMHHFSDPRNMIPTYNQGIPIEAIRSRLSDIGRLETLGNEAP